MRAGEYWIFSSALHLDFMQGDVPETYYVGRQQKQFDIRAEYDAS